MAAAAAPRALAARGLVLDHAADWVEELRAEVEELEVEARTLEASAALARAAPQPERAESVAAC